MLAHHLLGCLLEWLCQRFRYCCQLLPQCQIPEASLWEGKVHSFRSFSPRVVGLGWCIVGGLCRACSREKLLTVWARKWEVAGGQSLTVPSRAHNPWPALLPGLHHCGFYHFPVASQASGMRALGDVYEGKKNKENVIKQRNNHRKIVRIPLQSWPRDWSKEGKDWVPNRHTLYIYIFKIYYFKNRFMS